MSSDSGPQPPIYNHILIALPREEVERLLPVLKHVELPAGHIMYEAGEPIRHAYFLNHGVASTVALMEDGKVVEVSATGNEGMVGIPLLLKQESVECRRTFMQIKGDGLRMRAEDLEKEIANCGPLHNLLLRYTHSCLTHLSQTAACNRVHPTGGRLARWLLTTSDRVRSNNLHLTQEFIAEMLGMRRAGVTEALGELVRRKLIRTSRGHVEIVDRPGLEAATCECYEIVKQEFNRLRAGERRELLWEGNGGPSQRQT
jgi:CRP-like cAMP-binding protein